MEIILVFVGIIAGWFLQQFKSDLDMNRYKLAL